MLDGSNTAALDAATRALSHPAAGVRKAAQSVLPPVPKSVAAVLSAGALTDKDLNVRLNALLASPSFQPWMRGVPLDPARLLHDASGKPRASIIQLAHLSEPERQFVVTLVLSWLVSWMRTQPGTSELRALVYMDEVAGFAPPTLHAQASRLNFAGRFFNLLVTNVPGPQFPLYVLGRKLSEIFPIPFLAGERALAVAIMSYDGKVGFGLLGDYDALPDLDVVAEGIEASLAQLVALAEEGASPA